MILSRGAYLVGAFFIEISNACTLVGTGSPRSYEAKGGWSSRRRRLKNDWLRAHPPRGWFHQSGYKQRPLLNHKTGIL